MSKTTMRLRGLAESAWGRLARWADEPVWPRPDHAADGEKTGPLPVMNPNQFPVCSPCPEGQGYGRLAVNGPSSRGLQAHSEYTPAVHGGECIPDRFLNQHSGEGRGGRIPPADPASAIEVRDLVRVFGDGLGVRALDGISLTVRAGEFLAIMGPSGSGKSTLLHLLGGLDRPTSGQIVVGGADLTRVRDLDAFRARTVGLIFQLHNLIPTLTALENVEVPMVEGPFVGAARRARARELLGWMGLGDRLRHRPGQLSGGQRQRVAIARALANQPALILADEPTGSLDSQAGAEVLRLLRDLNRTQGTTIVLVTHDPLIALATDRIVTLRDGRVQRDQPVADADRQQIDGFRRSEVGRLIFGEELEARS